MRLDIERSVKAALNKLFNRDAEVLRNDVNKRTITHKFAEYLESKFPGWDVDCEYNRNHDQTKRLESLQQKVVRIDNTDGISVTTPNQFRRQKSRGTLQKFGPVLGASEGRAIAVDTPGSKI